MGPDLKTGSPEYEADLLHIQPKNSVGSSWIVDSCSAGQKLPRLLDEPKFH
jgi:hypothetical protein